MKVFGLLIFLSLGSLSAETLHLACEPKDEKEKPYRTFHVTIFEADSRDPQSETSFASYDHQEADIANSAGIVNGFSQSETYSTHVSSRYRNITLQGGILGFTWQRDTLQLQKKRGSEYRGSFYFPEGSEQLDLPWNSNLILICERL